MILLPPTQKKSAEPDLAPATGDRSAGNTAKVWDAATGKEVLTLSGHNIYDLMTLARGRVTTHSSEEGCKKYLHVDKCPFPEFP